MSVCFMYQKGILLPKSADQEYCIVSYGLQWWHGYIICVLLKVTHIVRVFALFHKKKYINNMWHFILQRLHNLSLTVYCVHSARTWEYICTTQLPQHTTGNNTVTDLLKLRPTIGLWAHGSACLAQLYLGSVLPTVCREHAIPYDVMLYGACAGDVRQRWEAVYYGGCRVMM
jgi:hypothetical protein